uniref:Arachidonate--CoA ligase n=1 Tax=Hucho hucho TaxID=62062 RepID=A0A4W5JJ62_9TELE
MHAQQLLNQLRFPELDEVRQYLRSLSTHTLVGVGAFAALTTYWYTTRPKALKPPCNLRMQSVEVPGGEYARRSALMDSDKHMTHLYNDAKTMYEFFLRGARVSNNGPCLGARQPSQSYEWLSYSEVAEKAENLGSALLHRGHTKTKDQFIGIFSQNRPEWTIAELACYTFSLVAVPLYDTLGTEAITYVIDKATISSILCDVPEKARLVLECVSGREHSVRTIILMEPFDDELVAKGKDCGIDILSLSQVEVRGETLTHNWASLIFVLSSSGDPKGAMLTHRNVASNCSAFIKVIEDHLKLDHHDAHISYLPLAHMFERVVQGVILVHGGRIGFFQGDIRLLMDDLTTLRPTVFPVVPRLLNRMFDKIYGQANTSLKRWVLDFAFKRKEAELLSGIVRRDSIWDKLIFRKVQASLGGRVRLMITGAAPVSATVLTFLRAALGCQLYEGYGQTECTAGCTMTVPGDWTAGHVGAPLPCNSVKLVDVAEMNYLAANGEGEVCVKGANVFLGYLKDPEKTEETIDANGWVHTGDIGKWLPNGTLKIVDRKKHIFKLAQGEYIAPEKIENIYTRSDAVAQVFVHGDSLQRHCTAIFIPHSMMLPPPCFTVGMDVKKAILEDILKLGKDSGLKSFEQVKDITLYTEMFSIQNGLLTPTLKAKRAELRNYFREQIDKLYSKIKM